MFLLVTFQNRHFLDNPQYRKKVFKGTSAWEGGRRQYRDPDTINFIALNGKKKKKRENMSIQNVGKLS